MTAIDIGPAAIDRPATIPATYTVICLDNPANADGNITSVELWFNSNAAGVKVGTFSGTGLNYTNRASATIGNVTAGSKQTFSGLSIAVITGDFLGIYWASGNIEGDTSGVGSDGYVYKAGDQMGAGLQTYTFLDYAISVYGAGLSGWPNISKVNGIAAASIAKINGVAVASISKINGVAV